MAAFKLNKLLYDSRFKPHMRTRLLKGAARVAAEYELNEAHTRALVWSLEFRHIDTAKPVRTPTRWWRPARTRLGR